MGVPLLDLGPQYEALKPELDAALARVAASQVFIGGPEVAGFEREVAAWIGSRHAIGVASGSDALLLALWALGIGPGDEVITTSFTFFATAGAISRLGARPVFVDIDPQTYCIDPAAVEAAITPRTRALIPVHLFGLSCDMDALEAICVPRGVVIVEDCAQSIGATWRGRQTGTIGTFGCYSFFPSKNLGCWGDGGLVTTDDDELAERVRVLKAHGSKPKYFHGVVGANSRLDALQAAVLRVKLPHLAAWNEGRRAVVRRYRDLVEARGVADRVVFQAEPAYAVPVYHQCVVRVPGRDAVMAALHAAGIGTAVYYPLSLHLQGCFADLGQGPGTLPECEAAQAQTLALPCFPELTDAQAEEVVDVLAQAVRAGG